MPLYYFHLRNGLDAEDEEGVELLDEAAARGYAVECARDLASADVREGSLNLEYAIEVTDGSRTLFRVPYGEAIVLSGRG